MRLLVDMNLPPKFADMLTDKGVEAVHWYNIGAPDAKDSEILTYAINHDFIVISCDLDFSTILSSTRGEKPSVVQVRTQDYLSEETASLIVNTVKNNKNALEEGAVLTINAKKGRLRMLPL